MPQALWQETLNRLKGRLSPTEIGCWVQAIHPAAIRERRLYGEVPSGLHLEQIRARLAPEIAGVLEELLGPGAELVLSVNKDRARREAKSAAAAERRPGAYSFDSFVVGESNALAHATALEVADRPGAAYNPLFLFGGVGLGKTHLASAVAHALGRGCPRRVSLVSAETLANELIRAIFGGGIDALRSRLRQLDALIVDDIQFLAGKERMQEEFFHTFNSLKAAGRQIVLASDQAPGAIANLEERLRSRFESGLIAEIRPPETSLRLAILEHKAKLLRFDLPLDVAHWVTEKVVSSVRELEGALHRLVAACRWSKRTLDLGFAKESPPAVAAPGPGVHDRASAANGGREVPRYAGGPRPPRPHEPLERTAPGGHVSRPQANPGDVGGDRRRLRRPRSLHGDVRREAGRSTPERGRRVRDAGRQSGRKAGIGLRESPSHRTGCVAPIPPNPRRRTTACSAR